MASSLVIWKESVAPREPFGNSESSTLVSSSILGDDLLRRRDRVRESVRERENEGVRDNFRDLDEDRERDGVRDVDGVRERDDAREGVREDMKEGVRDSRGEFIHDVPIMETESHSGRVQEFSVGGSRW
jgi:hypothetical protein